MAAVSSGKPRRQSGVGRGLWRSPSIARRYLNEVKGAVPQAAEHLDIMMHLISASGRAPRNVLDLGCGDGILAGIILDRYPRCRAILLDSSEPMLIAARRSLAGFGSRVHFVRADFGRPDWSRLVRSGVPFDCVVSRFAIHHQFDGTKLRIYREIHRLLAPGGVFVNIEHVKSATRWASRLFDNLFIDSLHRVGLRKGIRAARAVVARRWYSRPDRKGNHLSPVERQCAWLRKIGYTDVDCYAKILELCVFGGRKMMTNRTGRR